MKNNTPVITITTSASHLAMAVCAFRKASRRDERVATAEKHKPYMFEADIQTMRERFADLPYPKETNYEQPQQAPPPSPEA